MSFAGPMYSGPKPRLTAPGSVCSMAYIAHSHSFIQHNCLCLASDIFVNSIDVVIKRFFFCELQALSNGRQRIPYVVVGYDNL